MKSIKIKTEVYMNTAYTNGAEQNTETGKRQMANFAEAAKGMGFAFGNLCRSRKKALKSLAARSRTAP